MTRNIFRKVSLFLSLACVSAGCGSSSSPSAKDWVGKTFLLDTPALSASHWTQPKGFGGDLGAYVPQLLIGVEAGAGSDLTITLTTAQAGAQDMCNPTTEMTASGADYPKSQITTPAFRMRIADTWPEPPHAGLIVSGTAHDMTLKNILPGNPDTSDSELDATLDIAELYPLVHALTDPTKDTVCEMFASYGLACAACAFNGQPYCLTLQAVQLGAAVAPTPVKKVLASDIAPTCSQ